MRSRSPVGSSHSSSVGIGDDGARDADALFLAARQFARLVLDAIAEPHERQRRVHALEAICAAELGEQQRQLDVALGGEHRQQVVHLEHEADVVGAPVAELGVRQPVDREAIDFDGARGRPVETAEQVQQRGLARARRPHERDEVAARQIQVELLEHRHHFVAALVLLGDATQARDHRIQLLAVPLPP